MQPQGLVPTASEGQLPGWGGSQLARGIAVDPEDTWCHRPWDTQESARPWCSVSYGLCGDTGESCSCQPPPHSLSPRNLQVQAGMQRVDKSKAFRPEQQVWHPLCRRCHPPQILPSPQCEAGSFRTTPDSTTRVLLAWSQADLQERDCLCPCPNISRDSDALPQVAWSG